MPAHRSCSPSMTRYHSFFALDSSRSRRCPRRVFTAACSLVAFEASRRHRDLMSPTAGPPRTRTISAVLPPSSETGRTWVTDSAPGRFASSRAQLLRAVPPEKNTKRSPSLPILVAATRAGLFEAVEEEGRPSASAAVAATRLPRLVLGRSPRVGTALDPTARVGTIDFLSVIHRTAGDLAGLLCFFSLEGRGERGGKGSDTGDA